MNRYLIIGASAVGILLVVWVVWTRSTAPSGGVPQSTSTAPYTGGYTSSVTVQPTQTGQNASQGTTVGSAQDRQAVFAAYQQALTTAHDPDNIKPYQTSVFGGYALQLWKGDNTGGEALLKFDTAKNTWTIVDPGGGAWSVDGLVSFGVPQNTAQMLLQGMPQ